MLDELSSRERVHANEPVDGVTRGDGERVYDAALTRPGTWTAFRPLPQVCRRWVTLGLHAILDLMWRSEPDLGKGGINNNNNLSSRTRGTPLSLYHTVALRSLHRAP